jgi:pyrroline-5-carboxylate reductase
MNILLIGSGRMGGAMARAWIADHRVLVFDPAAPTPVGADRVGVLAAANLPDELIVVLAVKPQIFPELAPSLKMLAARGTLFVSIMAGITLAGLGAALGGSECVVRAMPNLAAAIGRGITAAVRGKAVSHADVAAVEALLRATGELVWLEEEDDLDAVTAVSGSGPAYFFRFTEALANAGVALGLEPALAMKLARAGLTGAAALAEQDRATFAELRQQVTSPGGTTAAGLAKMDEGYAVDRLLNQALTAAAARSRELAG